MSAAGPRARLPLLAALLLGLGAGGAGAVTRNVPGDFPLLQDALALSADGDTVKVAPGVYGGAFVVPAGVALLGSGSSLTTIDAGGAGRALDCSAGAAAGPTRIEDLRVAGGSATPGALVRVGDGGWAALARAQLEGGVAAQGGGGLYAGAGSRVVMADVEVAGCSAARGAGVLALGADLTLDRVELRDNIATAEGGGVLLLAGAQLSWIVGSCHDNRALADGGGLAVMDGVASLGAVTLADNHADGRGGALYCAAASTAVLATCDLLGNRADVHGGAVATSCDAAAGVDGAATCSLVQLSRCDVVRNSAPLGAAGAAAGESQIQVTSSIIADHPSGLACLSPIARLDVSCSLVYGNGQDLAGTCLPTPGSGWVQDDPHFCNLALRDLRLCANSPALNPGCGEVHFGSHGVGCAACAPSPAQRTTWGALKSRYR